jgi:hypothetical protein
MGYKKMYKLCVNEPCMNKHAYLCKRSNIRDKNGDFIRLSRNLLRAILKPFQYLFI